MSNHLKKEFKHSDVERIRNLVKKDFTNKTKSQTGYRTTYTSCLLYTSPSPRD